MGMWYQPSSKPGSKWRKAEPFSIAKPRHPSCRKSLAGPSSPFYFVPQRSLQPLQVYQLALVLGEKLDKDNKVKMAAPKKTFPMCGATYIGQIEHEFMHSKGLGICANCMTTGMQKPLRRCSGCIMVDYCSKEYVAADFYPRHSDTNSVV
jgi:hypothetical protein